MVRKHIKREPDRWYYHCDRLGLLVWQDIPNATSGDSPNQPVGQNEWVEENFIREMKNIMNSLKNVPSIITWVIFNEGWGQYEFSANSLRESYTRKVVQEATDMNESFASNSRLINAASGWVNYDGLGDYNDRHNYPFPAMNQENGHRAVVCGEYGGVGLKIENHIWNDGDFFYHNWAENSEELKKTFISSVEMVRYLKQDGLSGAVYTQIIDVESEINGLISYDRKIEKWNETQIREVQEKLTDCIQTENIVFYKVLSSSKEEGQTWKYSFQRKLNSFLPTFNDETWETALGGFGSGNPPNSIIRTPWSSQEIVMRKQFYVGDISEAAIAGLMLEIYHDEDVKVYINGYLCAEQTGYMSNYSIININEYGKNAIKKNDYNLIAVQCINKAGGQYIDAGLITSEYYEYTGGENGLKENNQTFGFEVYPNPTESCFQVQNAELLSNLEVYSLDGKLLKIYAANENYYCLSNLQSGVFLLKMHGLDKNTYIRKIKKNY
jgi:hypothetical protein